MCVKVLGLLSFPPFPPLSGPQVRNFHLWPALQRCGVEVRLLCLIGRQASGKFAGPPGVETEFCRYDRDGLPRRALEVVLHSYHQWPRSKAMAACVDDLVASWRPDVIHAEELRMAFYLPRMRGLKSASVESVTFHNVESSLLGETGSWPFRFGRRLVSALHSRSLTRFEQQAASLADVAFAYSRDDLDAYRSIYPAARWALTSNGVDAQGIVAAPQVAERNVLIVGSLSWGPNIRGLFWFLDHVLGRLGQDVSVTVAGSSPTAEVRRRLAASGVRLFDTPLDLGPLYARHALCAVPLLEGSGTRGKILEACAYERVVVTTSRGIQGLELKDAPGVDVADDPGTFAERLRYWLDQPGQRAEAARATREVLLRRYDWSVVAKQLVDAWQRCASR